MVLQYALLAALYYFLYRVFRMLYLDFFTKDEENKKAAPMASLTIISSGSGDIEHKRYKFDNYITIGRNPDNDIVLDDKYISHYHARVKRIGNDYMLDDLDSINSTYLNGNEIAEEVALRSGDCIKVGMVVLKFER